MQLYSDFQCPACKLFVTSQLARLLTDFVVPGTLRIEAQDIAFLGQWHAGRVARARCRRGVRRGAGSLLAVP